LRRGFYILIAAGLLALGFWAFRLFFPSDEKLIRKLLAAVAQTASLNPNDSALVKLAGANKLAGFFTADVIINLDVSGWRQRAIKGRDELVELAAAARANLQEATIQLHDIVVEVAANRETATVQLTALTNINGSADPIFQLLRMRLKKIDRDWKISYVDSLKTPGV